MRSLVSLHRSPGGSRSETPASMAVRTQIQVAFAAKASEHHRVLGIFGHRRRAFRSVGEVECRTARRGLEGGLVCCQKTGPGPRATSSVRWLLRRCCTTLGSITSKHIYYTKAYYLTEQELRFDGVHPWQQQRMGIVPIRAAGSLLLIKAYRRGFHPDELRRYTGARVSR